MASISMFQRPLTPTSSNSSTAMSDAGSIENSTSQGVLKTALHVIRIERDALTALEDLYETDTVAQEGLAKAVNAISNSIRCSGKLVVSGVGKSGKICKKVVATMNSFGIRSVFLHPTEALHGDLGTIGENDTILLITFSGRTPEIFTLLPYLPLTLPIIAVTSQTNPSACALFDGRPGQLSILLPAPIPVSEVQTFGVAAPTTSTTVAIALTDALALAAARHLHPNPSAVFKGFHPGGAIGGAVQVTSVAPNNGNRARTISMDSDL